MKTYSLNKEDLNTLKKLKQEVKEKYFNILCTDICGSQAYRVIGVAEDDLDFYYITKAINGEIKYQTALINPIPLISLEQYKQLDEVYEQNGCSKEETLVIDSFESRFCTTTLFRSHEKLLTCSPDPDIMSS